MLSAELIELAQQASPEKRGDLLFRITNMFFDGVSERNVSEEAMFEEIVNRLSDHVALAARVQFSERIAEEKRAPRRVVIALANDVIAVARPVLQRSPLLNDNDLTLVASTASDDHLHAITLRQSLSEVVTDVLLDRGSLLVIQSAVRNTEARFSPRGFRKLIHHAETAETLHEDLVARKDMPVEVVLELAPLLSKKLRATLASMGVAINEQITPQVADTVRNRLAAAFEERDRETRDIAQVIVALRSGSTTLERELPLLARQDRAYDISTLVADLASIDHATAMKALTGKTEEPLIVLFRSLDVTWETFETVLQLRARRQRENYKRSQSMHRTYDAMPRQTAERVLRFLQMRRASEAAKVA